MKITLISLSLLFIVSCKKERQETLQSNNSAHILKSDSVAAKNDSIKTVDDIKNEYAIISGLLNSKKLDSTTFNYNCDEKEGEVTFYFQDKKLKMVKDFYAEHSHFSSSTKYFVKDDQVFFIFNEETVWNFDDGGTPEKPATKDNIKERRIYILNDKAIQCFEKNYTIRSQGNNQDPNTIANKETKCDISEFMKQYKLIIKNKDKKNNINCL
ncbi:hypothetical protein [Chryseobacterium taichungense]|uniref:hypothetical protein n=1 Tax=Chryseobacterium taichungense TaxID=295069 RepID=UPI0028A654D6|nr:hypothetical protein [Chryseobacterium taichungense]